MSIPNAIKSYNGGLSKENTNILMIQSHKPLNIKGQAKKQIIAKPQSFKLFSNVIPDRQSDGQLEQKGQGVILEKLRKLQIIHKSK